MGRKKRRNARQLDLFDHKPISMAELLDELGDGSQFNLQALERIWQEAQRPAPFTVASTRAGRPRPIHVNRPFSEPGIFIYRQDPRADWVI